NDDSAAPASEEDQNHEPSETGGDNGLAHHALDRSTHKQRLVGQLTNAKISRQALLDLRQETFDTRHDVERRRVPGLLYGEQNRSLAIHARDVGLRWIPVANVGDVANVDSVGADRLDRQIVQLCNGLGTGVHVDVIFQRADLGGARGQDQVLYA